MIKKADKKEGKKESDWGERETWAEGASVMLDESCAYWAVGTV